MLDPIPDKDGPRHKTDALGLMKGIKSVHTTGKYLDTVIE